MSEEKLKNDTKTFWREAGKLVEIQEAAPELIDEFGDLRQIRSKLRDATYYKILSGVLSICLFILMYIYWS